MDSYQRDLFNSRFTQEAYEKFLLELNTLYPCSVDFRVSETPLFLTDDLRDLVVEAGQEIASQIMSPELMEYSKAAVPSDWKFAGETPHPDFLQIDFALCEDGRGGYLPQLIELQAFASLYFYQIHLERCIRKYAQVPPELTTYFGGISETQYVEALRKVIVGKHQPSHVVLLEVEPEKQYTRIDFEVTRSFLGVSPVCITKIWEEEGRLFYENRGKKTRIERIYNRVIPDELLLKKPPLRFSPEKEYEVEWAGHPNWFFRVSKHSLPRLRSRFVPESRLLSEIETIPSDLENYVLKPLYSFAGAGVEIDLDHAKLCSLKDPEHYLLQRKVEYAPLVRTPDGFAKAEIRMMWLWDGGFKLINNLVRMSKGKMVGVSFNKDKSWVGSSLAYHR